MTETNLERVKQGIRLYNACLISWAELVDGARELGYNIHKRGRSVVYNRIPARK